MANFGTATFTAVLNNAPLIAGAAEARGALGGIGRGLNRVGTAITQSVTVPTVIAGGVAVTSAIKIEKAWNEVRKVYNAPAKQIEKLIRQGGKLEKAVTNITTQYGLQRAEIIGVLGEISAMGFKGKDATTLLKLGIENSIAAGISLEDGLKTAVSLMQTFQLRGKKLDDTLAGLNLTENETAARGLDLSVGLARAGGAAEAIVGPGFKASEAVASIAAGMAVLKERGQETYRSADALRAVFQRIYVPPAIVEPYWEKMGVDIADAEGNLKPFPTLLKDVAKNFDKLSQQEQLAFSKRAIGVEFGPLFIQMIKDVQRGVESGDESNSTYLQTVKEFADVEAGRAARQRELTIAQESMSASVGRVRAAWDKLVDVLTPIIAEYLHPISEWIVKMVDKFAAMDKEQQKNILKWVALGAAIGPVLVILGTVFGAVGSALAGFGLLKKFKIWKKGESPIPKDLGKRIWNGLKRAFLFAFRMLGSSLLGLMGPLGAAFSVAFGAIASKLGPFFKKFGGLFKWLPKVFGPLLALFGALNPIVWVIGILAAALFALSAPGTDAGDLFETLKDIWAGFIEKAKEVWEAIQPILKWLQTTIAPLFRDAFLDLFDALKTLFPLLKPIGILIGAVLVAAVVAIGIAFRVFAAVVKFAAKLIVPIIMFIVRIFTWLYDKLVGHSVIPDLINGIIKWFKLIAKVVWPLVKTYIRLIMGIFKVLWGVAKAVFKGVWNAIKFAWGIIKVILKAFWWYLKSVLIPIIIWLYQNVVKKYFKLIGDIIKGAWEKVIKPIFSAIKDFIEDKLVPAFRTGVDKIKTIWDGLKAAARVPVEFLVNTVYMQGIRAMMNKIPGVNLPAAHFAHGGPVFGSKRGRDSVPAMLMPGEHVWTAKEVAAAGGHGAMYAMREAIQGYARGGAVEGGKGRVSGAIPAAGSWSQHTSGYPWATWAGDINVPGDADLGAPVRAAYDGIVAFTKYMTSSYGWHVGINHPNGSSTLYAHLSKILVNAGLKVARGDVIGAVGSTGNSTGPHLHYELRGGTLSALGAPGRAGGMTPEEAAKDTWWDTIKSLPGMIKNVWNSLKTMSQEGWPAEFAKAGKHGLGSAAKYIDDLIPDKWLPDNPAMSVLKALGVFDRGGMLQPGGMAVNLSRRPEPVFTGAQWDRLFPALDAMANVRFNPADMYSEFARAGDSNNRSSQMNITINNPVPERATVSLDKQLRQRAVEAGWIG